MIPVDGDFILSIAPKFTGSKSENQARIVQAISAIFARTLDDYAINTKLRIAHFIAQVTHESAGFRATEEFASGSAYEGRKDLGNVHKGDGKRYKGRGLIQLTGRANYRQMGERLNLDLESKPELATEPLVSLKIACEYWKSRNINQAADQDDLIKVTRLVNGGLNGLDERSLYLKKAKEALSAIEAVIKANSEGGNTIVLRRGSRSDEVGELQKLLKKNGFNMTIDNEFGAATELAVILFQRKHGIDDDGIVGSATWMALRKQTSSLK